MTTLAWPQEATLEAQQRICLECGEERGAWLVQRAAQAQDLWHLAHAAEGGSYTIAAAEPVCPRCGTTLLAPLELGDLFEGALPRSLALGQELAR